MSKAPQPADRMRSLSEAGVWWLPSAPEHTVAGTLLFDGSEPPRLELIGMLRPFADSQRPFEAEIVVGQTTSGVGITLLSCTETGSSGGLGDLRTSTISARVALVGAQYSALADVKFRSMAVMYDHLSEWAGQYGLREELRFDERQRLVGYVNEYTFPTVPGSTVQGCRVRFSPRFGRSGPRNRRELTESIFLTVEPPAPRSLDEFFDFFHEVRTFLSLGVGGPLYPIAVEVKPVLPADASPDASPDVLADVLAGVSPDVLAGGSADALAGVLAGVPADVVRRRAERHTIEVLYATGRERSPFEAKHPNNMLFTLSDLGAAYGEHLNRWFEKAEQLKPVYDLYAATVYGTGGYLEARFLTLAQAVESYHRRTENRAAIDGPTADALRQRLRAVIDDPAFPLSDEQRTHCRGKLGHFHELGLKARVQDVLAAAGDLAGLVIDDQERFAKTVVHTRNYLTHFEHQPHSVASDPNALDDLIDQLRFLLEVSLLREIGLSDEQRADVVRKHQRYVWLKRRLDRQPRG